jgi:GH18 family chitinase
MVNLMSYDFFGAFDNVTGINSPLYASEKATGTRAIFNTVRFQSAQYQNASLSKINILFAQNQEHVVVSH